MDDVVAVGTDHPHFFHRRSPLFAVGFCEKLEVMHYGDALGHATVKLLEVESAAATF